MNIEQTISFRHLQHIGTGFGHPLSALDQLCHHRLHSVPNGNFPHPSSIPRLCFGHGRILGLSLHFPLHCFHGQFKVESSYLHTLKGTHFTVPLQSRLPLLDLGPGGIGRGHLAPALARDDGQDVARHHCGGRGPW